MAPYSYFFVKLKILNEEKISRLRIIRTIGIGSKTFYSLLQKYGTAKEIISFCSKDFISEKDILKEVAAAEKIKASFIFFDDEKYPETLKKIENPPPLLMAQGNLSLLQRPQIAIVGARRASLPAQRFVEYLSKDLGVSGFIITSGLARGIDTAAHKGALSNGTIAVMATGLDITYPNENKKLCNAICEKGVVLSEMPLGQQPQPTLFPRRNRIIAGLAQGVILVEAALKSGSMITAQFALEHNREVFAVPGFPMDIRIKGCHKLLKEGAHLCEGVDDVLDVLNSSYNFKKIKKKQSSLNISEKTFMGNELQNKILNLLGHHPVSIDDLLVELSVSSSCLTEVLIDLELQGNIIKRGQMLSLS